MTEILLSLMTLLLLGAYKYTNATAKALWDGMNKLREEFKADLKELKDNDLAHLTDRVEDLERRP